MEGFGLAFQMLDALLRLCISKMAHRWNNTGHQRQNIQSIASSQCPACHKATRQRSGTYPAMQVRPTGLTIYATMF